MALKGKNKKKNAVVDDTGSSLVRRIISGEMVDSDFFGRHWVLMLTVLFILFTFISGKYTCMTSYEEKMRLQDKLDVTYKEFMRVRSEYMGKIRESVVKQRVDSLRMNLDLQEVPAYQVVLDK
ncbi:MAG: hypothetical protein K2M94_08370 [Paramuribaculum sp.]|nr:hypothetical protein [Paramuribaculum sp.]